jgi:LysR family transcriptional regulator, regulator for bpeEF and oprC
MGHSPRFFHYRLFGHVHFFEVRSKLVPILQDYAPPGVPIAVIYAQKRYLSAKIKVFVEFMLELMEQLKRDQMVE